MNTKITILGALTALLMSNTVSFAQSSAPVTDTIYTGAGYANEVYYSMANGNMGAVNRKQWDIAIRASTRSASILTNDAANNNAIGLAGAELYTYPTSDTSGWATADTVGISTWKLMVNSTSDWEKGAFNQYQKGHPDYGWGIYNAVTHDLVGDSLYIIKLRDGSFRKLWIVRKYSAENKVALRYANLDGSGDTSVLVSCSPYSAKNFLGFSLINGQPVDFEPVVSSSWDILFTKYMYTYPDGTLYPVTGVLSNYGIKVNKFEHVAPGFQGFDLATMDSTRSPIGWQWKFYDFDSSLYRVVDSLVYFVQNRGGNIYKLVYKGFAGSSTGRIILEKQLISTAGINETPSVMINIAVFPNPASTDVNLVLNPGKSSYINILMTDISGRPALQDRFDVRQDDLNTVKLPVNNIPAGVYLLTVSSGLNRMTRKVIIQH